MSGVGDPVAIFTALNDAAVDYVVIGGMAVILHGVVRTTMDVDIMISPLPTGRDGFETAFAALEATDRGGEPFGIQGWPQGENVRVTTACGPLDIMPADSGPPLEWADIRNAARRVILASGCELKVVSLEHLVVLKQRAGRYTDLADLESLECVHGPLPLLEPVVAS